MKWLTLAAVLLLAQFGPALAAETGTAKVEAQIRALGKRWDGEVNAKTTALYDPLLAKVSRADLAASADLAYGPDAMQKLDIFAPKTPGPMRPIVVYIHGGGMVRGDKDSPNHLTDSNVPVYFAHHGMVGVSMNYRLVPAAKFPSGGADVALAVAWLHANAPRYGGNPDAIFLIGHSAGGTVLGTYLYDAQVNGPGGPAIAGAIFLSGVIELDKSGPRADVTRQYYGTDESAWPQLDSYAQIETYGGKRVPTFIINAELDPTEIELPGGVRHFARLCEHDKACPRYYQARNMNHVSTAYSLGTEDDSLGVQLRDFIRGTLKH
jgi:acetyl esterase